MKSRHKFALLVLGLYLLLLAVGYLRGGGTARSELDPVPMNQVDYAISPQVQAAIPENLDDQWLRDIGLSTPAGSRIYPISQDLLALTNTAENQELFAAWLQDQFGPAHWRWGYHNRIDLTFRIRGILFGYEKVTVWDGSPYNESTQQFEDPIHFSILVLGHGGPNHRYFIQEPWLVLGTQAIATPLLPGWLVLLLLVLCPSLLIYILRRPILRLLPGSRSNA